MSKWMRRIRGAVGLGLTWAAAWFAVGMGLLVVVGPDAADVPFPIGFAALGFLAGATFSGVLAVTEGHRRFDQMSLPRFAGWGALGGLVFAGLFVSVVALTGGGLLPITVLGPMFALFGAGSAAGTLALARRADESRELGASDEVGLTADERRELLGRGE
jgi:hypothetical protein